jgi:hypothetical protein
MGDPISADALTANAATIHLRDEVLSRLFERSLDRMGCTDPGLRHSLTEGVTQLIRIEAVTGQSGLVPSAVQRTERFKRGLPDPAAAGEAGPNRGYRYQIATDLLIVLLVGLAGAASGLLPGGAGVISGIVSAQGGLLVNILSSHFGGATANELPADLGTLHKLILTIVREGGAYSESQFSALLRWSEADIHQALRRLEGLGLVRGQGQTESGVSLWAAAP